MTDPRAAYEHNKLLYTAQQSIVPIVLRDFLVMQKSISRMLPLLERDIEQCESLSEKLIALDHGDNCDACATLRNIRLRYLHDINLFRIHLQNSKTLWKSISKEDSFNSASAESFLMLALSTRAILDNVFRSSVLFLEGDIRAFNKQIADSLTAFRKLIWSTLPQNIDHGIDTILNEYQALSNSKKNDSELYIDRTPTFKSKIDYFRNDKNAIHLLPFLDDCERFYSAFSDMVHGGSAALAASNLKGPQIVLGTGKTKYIASAHQLAELIGITLVVSHGLLVQLYLPVLVSSLSCIAESEQIKEQFVKTHLALSSVNADFRL